MDEQHQDQDQAPDQTRDPPPEALEVADYLHAYLDTELEEMRAAWKPLFNANPFCPTWTWDQVAEALLSLTDTPVEELVIRGALSGLVKQSPFKPPELILAELIRLIRASHDLVFQRLAREMLEAEMP